MEPFEPNRSGNSKTTFSSTERFLGVPSHAPPLENPTSSSSSSSEELDEDEVVFFSDDYTEPNYPSSTTTSPSSSTPNHHHIKGFGFGPPDSFGILAALPENAPNGNHFFRKASVSVSLSSSSSSSRSIHAIPKPPPLLHDRTPSSSSVKYHQSAPVNVPMLSPAMKKAARGRDDDDDGHHDAAEVEEMVPPHEMVARNSPMVSCSVLEGMGRTLKGRDLCRIRNAVWRQTGFLD